MITLHEAGGNRVALTGAAIARVTQAGASSQWHGIRAYIKCFDGRVLEVEETFDQVLTLIEKDAATSS